MDVMMVWWRSGQDPRGCAGLSWELLLNVTAKEYKEAMVNIENAKRAYARGGK